MDRTESDICAWCLNYLATTLESPPAELRPEAKFSHLGLDSGSMVTFLVALEEWLGRELDPEIMFEFPSVAALAKHLASSGE